MTLENYQGFMRGLEEICPFAPCCSMGCAKALDIDDDYKCKWDRLKEKGL